MLSKKNITNIIIIIYILNTTYFLIINSTIQYCYSISIAVVYMLLFIRTYMCNHYSAMCVAYFNVFRSIPGKSLFPGQSYSNR